ncbi:MAG: RNA 2'-phosphotransferase [Oscillospiraceae bacterium]|nr:RNA 2'-phosphotransferase [Oscillospiraceae bacterium]
MDKVSRYLCFLLRHDPAAIGLDMDPCGGWVRVDQLLRNINAGGTYRLSLEELQAIVATDQKGRYRFNEDGSRIKACQGHSIPWVTPELIVLPPPEFLYHGTNSKALQSIMQSGAILPMKRHAVHMQADVDAAWKSAQRWKGKTAVVIKIAANEMKENGYVFSVSDNNVWFCEKIPTTYIAELLWTSVC